MTAEKLITVKSLAGVSVTILKDGKEVAFTNGIANVSREIAQELISRVNKQYVIYNAAVHGDHLRTPTPSIQNLELEFQAISANPGNFPLLRNWLREKAGIIEPALLQMQMEGGRPLVPGQNMNLIVNPSQNTIMEQGGAASVDDMPIDGSDAETTLKEAEKVLQQEKKGKK